MASSVAYPSDLPLDALQNLITAIKGGNLAANRQAVAKDIWMLEGYLLGHAFGEPGLVAGHRAASFAIAQLPVPGTSEILLLLEQFLTSPSGEAILGELAGGAGVLLKWLKNKSLELLHLSPVPLPTPGPAPTPAPAVVIHQVAADPPAPPAPPVLTPAPAPRPYVTDGVIIEAEDDATECEPTV